MPIHAALRLTHSVRIADVGHRPAQITERERMGRPALLDTEFVRVAGFGGQSAETAQHLFKSRAHKGRHYERFVLTSHPICPSNNASLKKMLRGRSCG
jgi:hypothetical protein